MRKYIIVLIISVLMQYVAGQVNRYGVPLVRNYATQITGGSEQNWCITKDKFGNIYFGNQDRGVIKYDGTKWTPLSIRQNPRIYSLESDSSGIIYVGAAYEFWYIQPGINGKPEYISLAERVSEISEIRFVYSIVVEGSKVLFLSAKMLYTYDTELDTLYSKDLVKSGILDAFRLVKIDDRLILTDNIRGLFELKDSTLFPLPGGNFFSNMSCTVLLPYGDNKIVIGTFDDGLYLYDYLTGDIKADFIEPFINEKFKKVFIYAASKIDEDLYAIGTTNQEGILVFNRKGELTQQINVDNSDLEDNTAYAMFCDYGKNSELWISDYGVLSKVYFNIPLTVFAAKQGIESGVNEISLFDGSIYLSSDAGLMKSYKDQNENIKFRKIPGLNSQAFPLEVINSPSGSFLLAGTLDGIIHISSGDKIRNVDRICIDKPEKWPYNARKILQSENNPSVLFFGLQAGGILLLKYENGNWYYLNRFREMSGVIYSMVEKKDGNGLWFITDDPDALYRLDFREGDSLLLKYGPEKGIGSLDLNTIGFIENDLYVSSSAGILKYNELKDNFETDTIFVKDFSAGRNSTNLYQDTDGDIWYSEFSNANHEYLIRRNEKTPQLYNGVLHILPDVPLMDILYYDGKAYLLKSKEIYVADKSGLKTDSVIMHSVFVNIRIGADSSMMSGTFFTSFNNRRIPLLKNASTSIPEISYDLNEIAFEWTTPHYFEELQTEYSYKLDGFEKNWSKWEGMSFGFNMQAIYARREYTNLPYGHYIFRVRTRTLTGIEGEELNYEFIILKPWYNTAGAYIGFAITAFLIVVALIKAYTRKLKNENIRLEGIVAERTAVVVKQKEELESSIHYASRIQMALLPSESILAENIPEYFILFKPRDIVSGDFYWMARKKGRLYVVAADCTGHGVPGAFMSLLGMSFLDEILDRDPELRADLVLREMRQRVTDSLKQTGIENESKDGMDLGLLVFDFEMQHVEFSGAYNPCYKVRKLKPGENRKAGDESEAVDGSMTNGEYLLETLKASKMPIGISSKMDQDYVFEKMPLEKGVSYYLSSDGYIDQFGGPDQRKFMKKGFKSLILEIQGAAMAEQKKILDARLKEWMGSGSQIDDILVLGVRIT
ncbi:MAG: SpoIIE family protein phosphatase [Bacteroidia bacterium]|nr:SpoIIE family protein phosphatase [Bacteroidia bacterium]